MTFRKLLLILSTLAGSWLAAQPLVEFTHTEVIERYDWNATGNEQSVRLAGLSVGDRYRIEWPAGQLEVNVLSAATEVRTGTFFWEGTVVFPTLLLSASSGQADRRLAVANLDLLEKPNPTTPNLPTSSLTKSVLPIQVEISDDAEGLVNAVFGGQNCFDLSNETYEGFYGVLPSGTETISQLGSFTQGEASVGIERGVILSTGRADRAEGPNTFSGTTQIFGTNSTDADLIQLAGTSQVFDAVILEFDFVPNATEIDFNYVFASEEYCEAVNNTNVDVFAFLISGPGIAGPFSNGAENIATLPNGGNVDVTSVNGEPGNFPNLYRSNVPESFGEPCQTDPPVAPDFIQYDGFTQILNARAEVIPCQQYHLKMILADVGDTFFDSAILLEAGAFTDGQIDVVNGGVSDDVTGGFTATEGCGDGFLVINRLDSATIGSPQTVYYEVSGGTADFGVDYLMPLDSFVIPAGLYTDTLWIEIVADQLPEGLENIELAIRGTCNCATNSAEFFIADPPMMDVALAAVDSACAGDILTIGPGVNGGVGPYTFQWSDGSADSLLNGSYTVGDTTYVVTVTDACQQERSDSVTLSAPDVRASLGGSFSLCVEPTAIIPVVLSGAEVYTITVEEDGVPATYTGGPDTIFLTYSVATQLILTSVEADGCAGLAQGAASVTDGTFSVSAIVADILCTGDSTGSVSLDVNGDPTAFTYVWAGPVNATGFQPNNLAAGNYDLTITDAAGCAFDTMITINEPAAAPGLQLDSVDPQTCLVAGAASLTASGGTFPYVFDWGDGGAATLDRNDLIGGQTYTVSLTDANNCQTSLDLSVPDERRSLDASIGGAGLSPLLTCANPTLRLGSAPNAAPVNYRWLDADGTPIGTQDSIDISQAGDYTLVVSDPTNGCADTSSIIVDQSNELLELDTGGPYRINCNQNAVDLGVVVTNYDGATTYVWTDADGNEIGSAANLNAIGTAGSYQVRVERTDNGCVAFATVVVTEDFTTPIISLASNSLTCARDTATSLVQNPNPNYSFDWYTTAGEIVSPTNTDRIAVTAPERYELLVTDESNGCTLDTFVDILSDERRLAALAGPDRPLPCPANVLNLNGTATPLLPGTTFSWRDARGNTLAETADVTITAPGRYVLLAIHPETGCPGQDTVLIGSEGPDSLQILLTQPPCVEIGGNIRLTGPVIGGSPPYAFELDGEPVMPDSLARFTGFQQGAYTLSVIDARGCRLDREILFFEPRVFSGLAEGVNVRLGEDGTLGFTTDRDGEIVRIDWEAPLPLSCTDCPTPTVVRPMETFVAYANLTDQAGCTLRLRQDVFVDRRQLIYAPTAFSPYNLDGRNDHFTLYGEPDFVTSINYLRVFDRWGALVWQGSELDVGNESQGWDGRQNGVELNGNLYIFTARVTYFDGSSEDIRGEISIVR